MDFWTVVLTMVTVGLLLYRYIFQRMGHFKELGVLHEPPVPIFGNMAGSLFRRITMMDNLQRLYNRYSNAKYFGFYEFNNPVIVIRDPELITSIAVKNFDSFCDHRGFVDEKLDPLMGTNLFGLKGDYWRDMRKLLSPAFTSSKMKLMFKLMCECAENLAVHMTNESKGGTVMNVKEIFSRCANDVVATCAFGINVDSMKNPHNDFFVLGKEATNFDSGLSLKFFLGKNFTTLSRILGLRMISERVTKFFTDLVADTVKTRQEQGIVRPDMIQLMMESQEKGGNITIDEMTSQAFVFFFGGFDSTSTFGSFLIHEIAVNPKVQAKVREEIEEVLRETDGKPTYETVMNGMKYFDAVINEALRMYPLGAFIDRLCVKEFTLPPAFPGAKPVTIKPGENLWFSSYALHRDPKYYPEPNKFDPQRFLNGSVQQSTYIPFGIGPRSCIGNRFALQEVKVLVFYLLWCCELEPCSKTTMPMVFSKKAFIMMPENGFWLKFRTRENAESRFGTGRT